ncbi:hypothetical protein PHMEG_00019558 [Phytophthora megakarya]|uniref:Uncharacterized protein n=1 Tax=Phytophthora megakarya TaxID=4795 RepID=A0A225VT66_9STRA|nr:hypothetical protein PHMEG_00019558 [Phytophthora megakarya]
MTLQGVLYVIFALKSCARCNDINNDVTYVWSGYWHLSIAASGELFLHIARIKTSVVQAVSIYKSPDLWQQCKLRGFELPFICYDEPSQHLFPLAPRFTESNLPGGKPFSKKRRLRSGKVCLLKMMTW